MRLLVDTHAFLWFVRGDPLLSATAKTYLSDPANELFLSIASCWEVAIKAGLKKLVLSEPCLDFLRRETAANQIQLLPASLGHVCAVETLPLHHRDPFDRLLVAQALGDQMPIVSNDAAFDAYSVNRYW